MNFKFDLVAHYWMRRVLLFWYSFSLLMLAIVAKCVLAIRESCFVVWYILTVFVNRYYMIGQWIGDHY